MLSIVVTSTCLATFVHAHCLVRCRGLDPLLSSPPPHPHTALCSQSLAVIRAAIPCIRAVVVAHLHPQHHGPVLGELDKVGKVCAPLTGHPHPAMFPIPSAFANLWVSAVNFVCFRVSVVRD